MSAAINYVMGRLLGKGAFEIPRQVLEVGFRDDWLDQAAPITLENKILNWVIKDRVIRDMDLVHGEEVLIDLSKIDPYVQDNFSRIYNVPPELTNNREIVSVVSVSYIPFNQSWGFRGGSNLAMVPMLSNDLTTAAGQVMNSVSAIPSMSSAKVDLAGYNLVRVTDRSRLQHAYTLRCYVANDDYLSNIVPRVYPSFAKLCILAIKAYLYNKLIVMMGDHYLQRGQELGIFKSIVEGWDGAAEEYFTYLKEEWAAVAYFNNEDQSNRLLQYMISPGL